MEQLFQLTQAAKHYVGNFAQFFIFRAQSFPPGTFIFRIFCLRFLLSFKKIYQTRKKVFYYKKHLKVRQKYSAVGRIFNSLLGV